MPIVETPRYQHIYNGHREGRSNNLISARAGIFPQENDIDHFLPDVMKTG